MYTNVRVVRSLVHTLASSPIRASSFTMPRYNLLRLFVVFFSWVCICVCVCVEPCVSFRYSFFFFIRNATVVSSRGHTFSLSPIWIWIRNGIVSPWHFSCVSVSVPNFIVFALLVNLKFKHRKWNNFRWFYFLIQTQPKFITKISHMILRRERKKNNVNYIAYYFDINVHFCCYLDTNCLSLSLFLSLAPTHARHGCAEWPNCVRFAEFRMTSEKR